MGVSLCCPSRDRLSHGVPREHREKGSQFSMLSPHHQSAHCSVPWLCAVLSSVLLWKPCRDIASPRWPASALGTHRRSLLPPHVPLTDTATPPHAGGPQPAFPCTCRDSTLGFTSEPSSELQVSLQSSRPRCTLPLTSHALSLHVTQSEPLVPPQHTHQHAVSFLLSRHSL